VPKPEQKQMSDVRVSASAQAPAAACRAQQKNYVGNSLSHSVLVSYSLLYLDVSGVYF